MAAKKKTEQPTPFGLTAEKVGRIPIEVANRDDADGNPAGGFARGVGFEIIWQDGPTRDADGRLMPQGGAFVEDVALAIIQRLEYYQGTRFATHFNETALDHFRAGLVAMESRRREREARGVDGTHAQ